MADATTTYAVDNTADVNVVAQTSCARIVVQENYNSSTPPTQDLLQKIPASAANAVSIPKGTAAVYTPQTRRHGVGPFVFQPGEIAGTIRTSAGSVTVQQIESLQI
jgi:hypothetical protein